MKHFELLKNILSEAGIDDSERKEYPMLEKIVSEVMLPEEGSVRVLLFLPKRDLISQYLVSGGGGKAIDSIPKDELENIALEIRGKTTDSSKPGPRLSFLSGRNFLFKDLLIPMSGVSIRPDTVVLMDIPSSIMSELKLTSTRIGALSTEEEINKFKESLKKMMSHKFYVTTLYIEKAKKIQNEIVRTDDVLDWIKAFDPSIILNYPNKNDLVAARDEWDDLHDDEQRDIENLEKQGEREERKRAAREKISPTSNEKLKNKILTYVLNNSSKSPDDMAADLISSLKIAHSKNEMLSALDDLISSISGYNKFADIKTKIESSPSW